jgi:GT2 family glycosyltransferase
VVAVKNVGCTHQKANVGISDRPIVSVVLGTYNRKPFLKACISSVRQELDRLGRASEIIVVDGGSRDGTLSWLSNQSDIITVIQHNRRSQNGTEVRRRSWGYFINLGFRVAAGKYICMLSDDVVVVPGAIDNGLSYFLDKPDSSNRKGGVAFFYREWPSQSSYAIYQMFGKIVHINHGLFLSKALKEIDYADEEAFSFYRGDNDLCIRLFEAGYRIDVGVDSFIEHYCEATKSVRKTNQASIKNDSDALYERWHRYYRESDTKNRFYDRVSSAYEDKSKSYLRFPDKAARLWHRISLFVVRLLNL